MSAFVRMYFQEPSLLAFQRRFEIRIKSNNLRTLFYISCIPKESQFRDALNTIEGKHFRTAFNVHISRLQRGKDLKDFSYSNDEYLCALDGTLY